MNIEKKGSFSNWKANWLLPVSAAAFFFLNMPEPETHQIENYWLSILAAFVLLNVLCARIGPVWSWLGKRKKALLLVGAVSGAGICLATAGVFFNRWQFSAQLVELGSYLPVSVDPPWLLGVYIARVLVVTMTVLSVPAGILGAVLFWTFLKEIFVSLGVFSDISRGERAAYLGLFAVILGLTAWAYVGSDAYYATGLDLVYTSDAGLLMDEKIFFLLTSVENDIRQPLFAVFTAPLLGIVQIVAGIAPGLKMLAALLIAAVQIAMILTAVFLLAKMLELNSWGRVCFTLMFASTYMSLLFSLLLEQYVAAFFWLILCVYAISQKRTDQPMLLYSAGGTLLTSMAFTLFWSDKALPGSWKGWLLDMVKAGLGFVAVLVLFGRFDAIYNAFIYLEKLSQFTGKDVYLGGKVYQFVTFARNCFLAPAVELRPNPFGMISWQLAPALGFNVTGLLVLVLTAVSALWNLKKRSTQLAAFWVGFSWFVLFVMGWGTQENGLILYALYFGWAYFVLLFQLLERVGQKLGLKRWMPVVYIVITACLLTVNLPAVLDMANFMAEHYPA